MSVTTWGKPSIYVRNLSDATNNWKKLDTPKEDTTQLNPTKGDTTEAKEEGGGIVDSKTTKSTYELVYQEFIKKGLPQPFPTIDGIIEGNYAIAVQPEDAENPGCYIGNSTVSVEESYSSADGALMQYTHKALVPEGDEVAKTTNKKGETVYCQFRWRIITAKKAKGKTDEYVLTFKHPAGATDTETEITIPTNGQVEGEP